MFAGLPLPTSAALSASTTGFRTPPIARVADARAVPSEVDPMQTRRERWRMRRCGFEPQISSSGATTPGPGSRSSSDTSNEPRAVFPAGSVAVQPTAVVPSANTEFEAGMHVADTVAPELSVAVAGGYEIGRDC